MARKSKKQTAGKGVTPIDVLELRMSYYNKAARDEIKKGTRGDPEKIESYLKQAQEAAKELAPFHHARLAAADAPSEEKRQCVIRLPAFNQFQSIAEWEFYYKVVEAREHGEQMLEGGRSLNERVVAELLERFKPDPNARPS